MGFGDREGRGGEKRVQGSRGQENRVMARGRVIFHLCPLDSLTVRRDNNEWDSDAVKLLMFGSCMESPVNIGIWH